MQNLSPETPEARRRLRQHGVREAMDRQLKRLGPGSRFFEVLKRVCVGVYSDGFIHAGNLAYLTLLTLFPFVILVAALARLIGRGEDALGAISGFLVTMPPAVRDVVQTPIIDVLAARTGSLLWLGALVALWTVGSFIETIRDILRRAYGTPFSAPFWHYRLSSVGIILASVFLVMAAFSAQVMITAIEEFVFRVLPWSQRALDLIGLSKLLPLAILWGSLYMLIWSLTPSRYRYAKSAPKWPGPLFVALWWYLLIYLLPIVLAGLGDYGLTYGSLAGVIIALIFFWFVGFGFTFGAHLNAALAEPPAKAIDAESVAKAEAA